MEWRPLLRRSLAVLLVGIGVSAGPAWSRVSLTGSVCGEDRDRDGLVEEAAGELAQCVDDVCPIRAVDCRATYGPPTCEEGGRLDGRRDLCEKRPVAGTWDCGSYTWNPRVGICEAEPVCGSGTYDRARNRCYEGHDTCPYGPERPCGDLGAGRNQCSPLPCVDLARSPPVDAEPDRRAYQDDGAVDPATEACSGFFVIFNGKASECLLPGYKTTGFNCCDDDESRFWFLREHCNNESVRTVEAKAAERAVSIGTYCKKKIPFIGCIQKAKVYCVFNSKLARMIHKQGRPQFQAFGPGGSWGSAKHPNCVGFTPEEFQALDFSQIDFEEFFGDLATPSPETIQDQMQQRLDAFYDQL